MRLFCHCSVKGKRNREWGQGWAPQPRLENFMHADALDEGGAHCWKGSFVSFAPPPFPFCPLPTHTQIQLSYIFSTAYHVIVETYAHKCADMCTGPGSTGRVRDTRCTAKILLILLLRSLFSFLPCFSFLSAVLFFLILKDNISNISLPCTGSIYNQICWSESRVSVSIFCKLCLLLFPLLFLLRLAFFSTAPFLCWNHINDG